MCVCVCVCVCVFTDAEVSVSTPPAEMFKGAADKYSKWDAQVSFKALLRLY